MVVTDATTVTAGSRVRCATAGARVAGAIGAGAVGGREALFAEVISEVAARAGSAALRRGERTTSTAAILDAKSPGAIDHTLTVGLQGAAATIAVDAHVRSAAAATAQVGLGAAAGSVRAALALEVTAARWISDATT